MRQKDSLCFYCLTKQRPSFTEDFSALLGKHPTHLSKNLRSFDYVTKGFPVFLLSHSKGLQIFKKMNRKLLTSLPLKSSVKLGLVLLRQLEHLAFFCLQEMILETLAEIDSVPNETKRILDLAKSGPLAQILFVLLEHFKNV